MKRKSIKKNYIYNTILTLSNMLFPLLTMPYILRIIGAEGIGKVNYVMSVGAYFIMFARAGMPIYGIKEISKTHDDLKARSEVFFEILIINTILMILALVLYGSLFFISQEVRNAWLLYLIEGVIIFLNLFSLDWLFGGIEEYSFITLRNIFIKIFSFILILILIKTKEDYIVYIAILAFTLLISNVVNLIHSHKYITFQIDYKKINLKRHFKPMFSLFAASMIGSVYSNFDVVLLGNIGTASQVGFYTVNRKLISAINSVINSLGTVMMPRLSYYISRNMKTEYNFLITKSINFILFLSLPAIAFVFTFSKDILFVFGGNEFLEAHSSLAILSLLTLISSLTSLLGFQVIMSHNDEKSMMKSNLSGAIVNLSLNVLLIRFLFHNGTSISIVLSEVAVFITQYHLTKKYFKLKLHEICNFIYLKGSILLIIILGAYKMIEFTNSIISLITGLFIVGICYFGYLLKNEEEFTTMIFYTIRSKLRT